MDSKTESDWQKWFERVWEYREETLYPSLFGQKRKGIFPVQGEMLTGMFKQEAFDPRWLHYGVFEFEPTPSRSSWLYVTSAMSNDWEAEGPDPRTPSGMACEFVFETTQQSEWAILRLLHLMVFQILLCHGRYPGKPPLDDFDRIPLRGPIRPNSVLTYLWVGPPTGFPRQAELESGPFDFYQIVGITETEAAHARTQGSEELLKLLVERGYFPVTDPDRSAVV